MGAFSGEVDQQLVTHGVEAIDEATVIHCAKIQDRIAIAARGWRIHRR